MKFDKEFWVFFLEMCLVTLICGVIKWNVAYAAEFEPDDFSPAADVVETVEEPTASDIAEDSDEAPDETPDEITEVEPEQEEQSRSIMDTPLTDYTITEGLLLIIAGLLLMCFALSLFKGVFLWQ